MGFKMGRAMGFFRGLKLSFSTVLSDVNEVPDEPSEETSSTSMPVLDPEIYDQEGEERPRKTVEVRFYPLT